MATSSQQKPRQHGHNLKSLIMPLCRPTVAFVIVVDGGCSSSSSSTISCRYSSAVVDQRTVRSIRLLNLTSSYNKLNLFLLLILHNGQIAMLQRLTYIRSVLFFILSCVHIQTKQILLTYTYLHTSTCAHMTFRSFINIEFNFNLNSI